VKPIYSGKVREIYDVSEKHFVIVTTDRISAFDNILPVMIKNKGVVLNKLSNFWFNMTRDLIPNHVIEENIEHMPSFFHKEYFRNRTVMVRKLDMLPFEFVTRGYIFGSMWKAYQKGEEFCGGKISGLYQQAQRLEQAVLTPAVKCDKGHDEYVDLSVVESEIGTGMTKHIVEICFKLYERCSQYAFSKGLIIADAKFEFGIDERGNLVLADEIFTPDSSRFWNMDDYKVGISPRSYDKQLVRDWLMNHQLNGEMQFDKIPEDVLLQTEQIYQECLHRIVDASESKLSN